MEQGLSGCKVELVNPYVIRKTSKDLNYNKRLMGQVRKQRFFKPLLEFIGIKVPTIHLTGYEEGLYYVEMSYLKGEKLSQLKLSKEDQKLINNLLKQYFELIKNYYINGEEFNLVELTNHKIKEDFYQLDDIIHPTSCHGDLTLDNILFDPETKQLSFIDFLDSYADHYYLDMAFLSQIENDWIEVKAPKEYQDYLLYSKFKRMLPYHDTPEIRSKIKMLKEKII